MHWVSKLYPIVHSEKYIPPSGPSPKATAVSHFLCALRKCSLLMTVSKKVFIGFSAYVFIVKKIKCNKTLEISPNPKISPVNTNPAVL